MIIDKYDPVMVELQKYVADRLTSTRLLLEQPTAGVEKTAELRGRIAELKKLQDWKGEDA